MTICELRLVAHHLQLCDCTCVSLTCCADTATFCICVLCQTHTLCSSCGCSLACKHSSAQWHAPDQCRCMTSMAVLPKHTMQAVHRYAALFICIDLFRAVAGHNLLTGASCQPSTTWQAPSLGSLAWLFGSLPSASSVATGTRFESCQTWKSDEASVLCDMCCLHSNLMNLYRLSIDCRHLGSFALCATGKLARSSCQTLKSPTCIPVHLGHLGTHSMLNAWHVPDSAHLLTLAHVLKICAHESQA